jgi:hypothetical protein
MSAGRPLFRVSNHHAESCGEPPAVDGDAQGKYVGYFANEHGEQAIYLFDFETGEPDDGRHRMAGRTSVGERQGGRASAHGSRDRLVVRLLAGHREARAATQVGRGHRIPEGMRWRARVHRGMDVLTDLASALTPC